MFSRYIFILIFNKKFRGQDLFKHIQIECRPKKSVVDTYLKDFLWCFFCQTAYEPKHRSNKAKAVIAKHLELNVKGQLYSQISVLVIFQFW